MKILLLVLLLLSGCGGAVDNAQPPSYDVIGESGLRVKYVDPDNPIIPFETIEQWYVDTQKCVDVTAFGPLVTFTQGQPSPGANGTFIYGTDNIMVINDEFIISFYGEGAAIKHEFVHYLLMMNGFPLDKNRNHESDLFGICLL